MTVFEALAFLYGKPGENLAAQIEREKAAAGYIQALDNGDFDTLSLILLQAERDPELSRMLMEIDQVFIDEDLRSMWPGGPSLN